MSTEVPTSRSSDLTFATTPRVEEQFVTVAPETMRGHQVTLSNHLTRAAEAIARFKPSTLVTADAPLDNMGKTGHSVYKHLQPLSTFQAAKFDDPTITPAGLKAFNTQISTVLRFATAHGSHLSESERAALQTNMLQTRGNLIRECVSRLQQCDPTDVRATEELCDVLNQAIQELTLNVGDRANVALIKEIDALLTGMLEATAATNPDIAPLLQSAQKRMHQNMLAIRKEEGMGQAHQATSETVQASIAPLISEPGKRGAKLKMSTGAPDEPALTAAGRKPGRWASIKARIKEFFGVVGRSKESQAACEVLMSEIEEAFNKLPRHDRRISREDAQTFLHDITEPLSENKWFQGALKNTHGQAAKFDTVRSTLMRDMLQHLEDDIQPLRPQRDETLGGQDAKLTRLKHLKEQVEELRHRGADKAACDQLIAEIKDVERSLLDSAYTELSDVSSIGDDKTLLQRLDMLSLTRDLASPDVRKMCNRQEAAARSRINARRDTLGEALVEGISSRINTTRPRQLLEQIRTGLQEILDGNPSEGTRRLAERKLAELRTRSDDLTKFETSMLYLSNPQNYTTEERGINANSTFLRHAEAALTFLEKPQEHPLKENEAAVLAQVRDAIAPALVSAHFGASAGTSMVERLTLIDTRIAGLLSPEAGPPLHPAGEVEHPKKD